MNFKTRMLVLTTLPILDLGIILFIICSYNINLAVYDQVYSGMHATDYAVRDIFEFGMPGEYQVKDDGCLWKGDTVNISEAYDAVDQIKEYSGFEVTVFYKDTRYLTTILDENGKRLTGTKASQQVIDAVLSKGEEFHSNDVDINGNRYIGYYVPLHQEKSNEIIGMVFLGKVYSEVNGSIMGIQKNILVVTLIVLICTFFITFSRVNAISKAIGSSMKSINDIAGGKLGIHMNKKHIERKDDIGNMCRSIVNLDDKLKETITDIKKESDMLRESAEGLNNSASGVVTAIQEVDSAVQSIAEATTSQAHDATDAGTQVALMSDMILDTENEVSNMKSVAVKMTESAKNTSETFNELNESMEKVKEAMKMIAERTKSTNESVEHINDVTNLITSIASQTNLLSLNASIEAARAGEHGKGFAVVATEIQHLSEQSNKSAAEIQSVLAILTEESEKTMQAMENVNKIVISQEEKIAAANKVFSTVENGINDSINGIQTIVEKSSTLEEAKNNTTVIVQSVAATAEENAASTEETAATLNQVSDLVSGVSSNADSLNTIAKNLETRINIFKIEE